MSGEAFRNSLRQLAHKIRAIPGQLGWRPYSVQVEQRAYSGDERGEGIKIVSVVSITEADGQPPRVRFLNDEEIALNGYSKGALEIGPITPDFPGGGTAASVLSPDLADNVILSYVITGPEFPNGARYRLKDISTDRAGHYMVQVDRAGDVA